MVTKSRTPRPPEPPKAPARKKAPRTNARHGNTTLMREKFILEYMKDGNGTQAAIRAGASPHSAHVTASNWLKRPDVKSRIDAHRKKVLQPLVDQFAYDSARIQKEIARLAFANILDFGRVDEDGEFRLDLSATTREQFAGVQSIKTKRTVRTIGEMDIEDTVTEFRLAPKREALVELAKFAGLYKEGVGDVIPVRFNVYFGPGIRPEPYPDEKLAFEPYDDEEDAA